MLIQLNFYQAIVVTLVLLWMEGEAFLGTHKDSQSLIHATQDTGSLEAQPERVSIMEYGRAVQLHARVSTVLKVKDSLVCLLMYAYYYCYNIFYIAFNLGITSFCHM